MTASSPSLTKYSPASLREVISLSFPFMLVLFSGSLMGLCDRLILSHYSLQAVEASISALYLAQLFQISCNRIASTAQIFVGQLRGAGEPKSMGPMVWQMIWFSLLSLVITLPLSIPIGKAFFRNTLIQAEGTSYFYSLMAMNFLFPMGASLSSFYFGQGQLKKVVIASLWSHAIHFVLDFPLVFGIQGLIPPLGVQGTALSAAIAQSLFCMILFKDFLSSTYRQSHQTEKCAFNWGLFWKCLQIGLPRAGSKILLLIFWACVTHTMIHKSGDYLAVLAFGGTIILFYTCFNEGLSQAVSTIGAYLIGAQQLLLYKLAKSASLFLGLGASLLALPFLLFPDSMIFIFFKEPPSAALTHQLHLSCYWLWLFFISHGLNLIFLGLLNAYGDTLFQMVFSATIGGGAQFLLPYLIIGIYNAPPHSLWLTSACAILISALAYCLRLKQEKWKSFSQKVEAQPK